MNFSRINASQKLVMVFVTLLGMVLCGCQRMEEVRTGTSNGRAEASLNITIQQEGMYQVPLFALGWEDVELENIQLYHRYNARPLWITGEGKSAKIHFYGERSTSPYTRDNVYQLKVGTEPGLRIHPKTAPPPESGEPSTWVYTTTRFEQNHIYNPLVKEGGYWFWTKLLAPTTERVEFELQDVVPGIGQIQVALWGLTEATITPDHHAVVQINGQQIAEGNWDGQVRQILEGTIPAGVLKTGTNLLEIVLPGDTGSAVDIVFLDWIDITSRRGARLMTEQQIFTTDAGPIQWSDTGAESYIFEVSDPSAVFSSILTPEEAVFQAEAGHRYVAVKPDGWMQPDSIEASTLTPDLEDQKLSADYVAIGPEDLLAPLQPLLDFRLGEGLTTMAIPDSAIYDQFNGGIREPEAIRAFLAHASAEWESAPKYILLVGDASYDYYNYTEAEYNNRLPTVMIPTVFGGETASDVVLADVNEDLRPDIAISRLPAQNAAQIESYVDKVLKYETAEWNAAERRSILAVADGQENIFKSDATRFLDSMPGGVDTLLISPMPGDGEAAQKVIREIDRSPWLTAYFGHGSVSMWGKDRLFTSEDVDELSSTEHPSIMLHFTCLTGLFTHPNQESLTERLLWEPEGGAIAVLAPTSLTLSYDQQHLSDGLSEALFQPANSRLGDAVLSAWRQIPLDSDNTLDVMRTYLLFGDPALKLSP